MRILQESNRRTVDILLRWNNEYDFIYQNLKPHSDFCYYVHLHSTQLLNWHRIESRVQKHDGLIFTGEIFLLD